MYNPNRRPFTTQPVVELIGIEKVDKMIDEYLAEDETQCCIKWAINKNDIENLKTQYTKYEVFREHLVFAIYKHKLQSMIFINELVTKKYVHYDVYMLYKCIEYNYFTGFRYLVSNGYSINNRCLERAIEHKRYEFIEYILENRGNAPISDDSGKKTLFNKAFKTGDKRILTIVMEHGAIVNYIEILNNHDISGLEIIREVCGFKYPRNTLSYVFQYRHNINTFNNTIVEFLDYLKATDIEKTIDWDRYTTELFKIAYSIGTREILGLFKDKYNAIPECKYILASCDLERLKLVREIYSDFRYETCNISDYIYSYNYNKVSTDLFFQFLDYVRETDIDKNITWLDSHCFITAISHNHINLVKYLVEKLDISYNIYDIDFNNKLDILCYLLEKIKPEESPLLNSFDGWEIQCSRSRDVFKNIDFDLPGFRPLIYMDNTNMHSILKKRAKRKRDYLAHRDRELTDILENLVSRDVAQYIICKYL